MLHDDERLIAEGADLVDAADRGVVERGGKARFLQQTSGRVGVRESLIDDLDRDCPLELAIARTVHRAHAAAANQRFDPIRADDPGRCR